MSEIINEIAVEETEVKPVDLPTEERAVVFEEALEAILFAAGERIEISRLAAVLEVDQEEIVTAVDALADEFLRRNGG